MANEMKMADIGSTGQAKFLAAKLLSRAYLKIVAMSLCDKVDQQRGTGTTAFFVRYKRMNVPLVPIQEGVVPTNSKFTLEQVTVTLDEWADSIVITEVAELTTFHPLFQTAITLLADNAQRVLDREVQLVMLSGTTVQYGDGQSATTRTGVTDAMLPTDLALHQAYVTLVNGGAPPRDGPGNMRENAQGQPARGTLTGGSAYVAVCGPEIHREIVRNAAGTGLWAGVHQYQSAMPIYNNEVGTYLGFRWVETNFIPKFKRLGDTVVAVTSGNAFGTNTPTVTVANAGGTLAAGSYPFKVTRKDLTRGFEEDISIIHTGAATTGTGQYTFNFAAVATGFVYNVYFSKTAGGGAQTDANLGLVFENVAAGASVIVTAIAAAGASAPPASLKSDTTIPDAVCPVYILGADALNWVSLINLKTYIYGGGGAKIVDPVDQFRQCAYKFMAKAMIKDQARLLRVEFATTFG